MLGADIRLCAYLSILSIIKFYLTRCKQVGMSESKTWQAFLAGVAAGAIAGVISTYAALQYFSRN